MIRLTDHRQLRETLRQLRLGRGLTQLQVAQTIHVSKNAVSFRENASVGLSTEALIDHARALGFTVALLPDRQPERRDTGTGWPAGALTPDRRTAA